MATTGSHDASVSHMKALNPMSKAPLGQLATQTSPFANEVTVDGLMIVDCETLGRVAIGIA